MFTSCRQRGLHDFWWFRNARFINRMKTSRPHCARDPSRGFPFVSGMDKSTLKRKAQKNRHAAACRCGKSQREPASGHPAEVCAISTSAGMPRCGQRQRALAVQDVVDAVALADDRLRASGSAATARWGTGSVRMALRYDAFAKDRQDVPTPAAGEVKSTFIARRKLKQPLTGHPVHRE